MRSQIQIMFYNKNNERDYFIDEKKCWLWHANEFNYVEILFELSSVCVCVVFFIMNRSEKFNEGF